MIFDDPLGDDEIGKISGSADVDITSASHCRVHRELNRGQYRDADAL